MEIPLGWIRPQNQRQRHHSLVLARLKSTNASSDIVENGGRGVPLKSLKNVLASAASRRCSTTWVSKNPAGNIVLDVRFADNGLGRKIQIESCNSELQQQAQVLRRRQSTPVLDLARQTLPKQLGAALQYESRLCDRRSDVTESLRKSTSYA